MPPKRKATAAKVAEVMENGSESADPPKAKRGKATKVTEKSDAVEEKKTRSTRAKAAPAEQESTVVEGETGKNRKTKPKGSKPAEKAMDEKASPKKKEAKTKKETKSKKEAKPKKEVTAAKRKSVTKIATKARSARAAKKGDDEMEAPQPSTTKAKKATKKKTASDDAGEASETKKKRAETKESNAESLQNQTETDYSKIDFSCTKENVYGKPHNFKISSWNVDGLRAWLKKNGLDYIEHEDPDILCFQETKCNKDAIPDELNKYKDYKSYWCCSEKMGYAGVALLTKEDPISVEYGIGNEEFDVEGRCITAEYNTFYVVNVYVPNAGRKLVTLPKRLEWNTLFNEFIEKLDEKKPVIVCGDMNVAHEEIDIANPKGNKKNAGFTQEERDGFTEFLADTFIDTYRYLYPEEEKAYTFWSYMMKARAKNIGWRLDYLIVSKRLMNSVCDNVIRTNVFGSDHCPITLFLNV